MIFLRRPPTNPSAVRDRKRQSSGPRPPRRQPRIRRRWRRKPRHSNPRIPPAEQARFDASETVHAGPRFGRKTLAARGEAAAREAAVLAEAGLSAASFNGFGQLLQGTRRHNLVYLDDLAAAVEPEGVRVSVTLPAGSYATVLLRELRALDYRDPVAVRTDPGLAALRTESAFFALLDKWDKER